MMHFFDHDNYKPETDDSKSRPKLSVHLLVYTLADKYDFEGLRAEAW